MVISGYLHQMFKTMTFRTIAYFNNGSIFSSNTFNDSSTVKPTVSMCTSGFSGRSKGESIPVKLGILPARALAYKPFTSLFSHSSNGVSTKTSMKFSSPTRDLAVARSSRKGEINAVNTIKPASTNSLDTSEIRRMFSFRLSSEKSRSLFNPDRTLSPSKMYVWNPF